ncbi:MAG: single-stranded DNA-binding protein [Crocinitomicaceae bacterium]|jgi:single-strand DNA-binding protein
MNNYVTLVGSIAQSPTAISLNNGGKIAKFALTTPKTYRKNNGQYASRLDWHRIFAWGNMASFVLNHAEVGKKVAIHGRLVHRAFMDKKGKKRSATEVELRQIIGL